MVRLFGTAQQASGWEDRSANLSAVCWLGGCRSDDWGFFCGTAFKTRVVSRFRVGVRVGERSSAFCGPQRSVTIAVVACVRKDVDREALLCFSNAPAVSSVFSFFHRGERGSRAERGGRDRKHDGKEEVQRYREEAEAGGKAAERGGRGDKGGTKGAKVDGLRGRLSEKRRNSKIIALRPPPNARSPTFKLGRD